MTYLDSYRSGFRVSAAALSPLGSSFVDPRGTIAQITTVFEQLCIAGQQMMTQGETVQPHSR